MDKKFSILVVDDEPDVVTMLRHALESEGFSVLEAYDGIAALDIAEREKPDLVLLDIMMPMMSGHEVCQQLKSNPQTQAIPVLCVTSANNETARSNTETAGAQGMLVKPFLPAELVAQIRRHLPNSAGETD